MTTMHSIVAVICWEDDPLARGHDHVITDIKRAETWLGTLRDSAHKALSVKVYRTAADAARTLVDETHDDIEPTAMRAAADHPTIAAVLPVIAWMRTHTGPSDGAHDILTAAVEALNAAGVDTIAECPCARCKAE